MLPRLWHEVIIKKYLQKKSVEAWFRQENKYRVGSSNFWRDLTSSLPVIYLASLEAWEWEGSLIRGRSYGGFL